MDAGYKLERSFKSLERNEKVVSAATKVTCNREMMERILGNAGGPSGND
tara:strand:- start:2248 stop:2394 length:147 start_codon:yes stop_codon:yes gene_type:complete